MNKKIFTYHFYIKWYSKNGTENESHGVVSLKEKVTDGISYVTFQKHIASRLRQTHQEINHRRMIVCSMNLI
jgi:hypothetical protein